MAIALTVNGVTYDYPETDDVDWGPDATDWAAAVTSGMLQKAGGLFQLLAEADFGTTYGLKSVYYKTRTANPADSGQFRLARADVINWRNQANSGNLSLGVSASNVLQFNGVDIQSTLSVSDTSTIDLTFTSDTLSADIIAGSITNSLINASAAIAYSKLNLATSIVNADINASAAIAYSKLNLSASIVNADISSSAAIAYSKLSLTGSIVNADISASAAIAFSKLAALSSGNILVGSAGGVATSVAMSGDATIVSTGALSIGANKVTNAMLAQIATQTFKGRTTASTGNVEDLTATQATAILNAMVGDSGSGGTKGLVPAPASGDAAAGKFLKANGSWTVPAGAGDVTGPASSTDNALTRFDGTTGKVLQNSSATLDDSGNLSVTSIASGTWSATTIALNKGGTGQTTKAAAFDALSPMTTGGDLIYGGASGTGTRLANGSAGQFLKSAGTTSAPTWASISASYVAPTIQKFTSGSGTYTTPTSPAPLYIRMLMVGGGGGGGGAGTTTSAGNGGTGGSTTINTTLFVAAGGAGGSKDQSGLNGAGGAATSSGATTNGIYLHGAAGMSGIPIVGTALGGSGGSSYFAGSGYGGYGGAIGGAAEANSGSGGGGAGGNGTTSNGGAGGGGAGGYIDVIIPSPAASYTYAIGAAGTAGSAGTSGFAGGAGGAGYLIVYEYYQ